MRQGKAGALALAGALLVSTATARAERPTPGNGYEAGVELFSYAHPDSRFKVWYVTEGVDAVLPDDTAPADGVPDFVAEVALVGDEVYAIFIDELGFRPPLVDTEYSAPEDAGGDDRYDIYLVNFANADGAYRADLCLDQPNWCPGWVAMENDFAEFNYPSIPLAIRVLVSHEYFHAVQNAYDAGQDGKWSEGTAVWAEEKAYPEQSDFERLIALFLDKPFRPFDRPSGSSFDGYPYGLGAWAMFLDERFGEVIVREIWEGLDSSNGEREFLTVTDQLLREKYGSTLADAWLEFTQWNLFTGDRADPTRAYASGAGWPSVAFEVPVIPSNEGFADTTQQTEGMSARYTPVTLPDLGGEARQLSIRTESGAPAVGTAYLWQDGALGEAMPFTPDPDDPQRATLELSWQGTPLLFVVITSVTRGAPMRTVTLSMGLPDEVAAEDSGGCRVASGREGGAGALLVMLAALVTARRRRRR